MTPETSFLKTLREKEKLLVTIAFPTVFSTCLDKFFPIFVKFEIVVCKLFQFGRV